MIKALLCALQALGFVGIICLTLVFLRWAHRPFGRLINWYWGWVSEHIKDDFYAITLSIGPLFALGIALVAFLICLGSK
jgi:hypothetical protein